jgi:hypothetical protein
MKRAKLLVALLAGIIVLLAPFISLAAEKEVKAVVSVAGTVPSKVDTTQSTSVISVTEVLADQTQSATISITLKTVDQNPLADINVCAYSNRGEIDKIIPTTADGNPISTVPFGISVAYAETQVVEGTTCTVVTTNRSGQAYFKVTSNVPGEAIITVIADNLVKLNQFRLTFSALPFPKDVTVSLSLPNFIGRLIPGYNQKQGTFTFLRPAEKDTKETRIVNQGVELRIPFWFTITVLFLVILTPFLIYIVLMYIISVRKTQQEEREILLSEAEDIKREEKLIEETKKEVESLKRE